MPLMDWGPKLSVGIREFDGEHQKLVGMVNDLFDAMNAGKGKDRLAPILDGLVSYTVSHFQHEERLMKQHGYAGYAAHKDEHDKLTHQVADIQQKFKGGATAALSVEVMNFLKNWLIKHIMGTDKAYTAFLNGKGVT